MDSFPKTDKRVGRPVETDPTADEQLYEQWLVARNRGETQRNFADARNMTLREAEKAIDRHRTRVKRSAKPHERSPQFR